MNSTGRNMRAVTQVYIRAGSHYILRTKKNKEKQNKRMEVKIPKSVCISQKKQRKTWK